MCTTCGCGQATVVHEHGHAHDHDHPHAHAHAHAGDAITARRVSVEKDLLTANDSAAEALRGWLAARGVLALKHR